MFFSIVKLFAAIICGKINRNDIEILASGQQTAQLEEARRQTTEMRIVFNQLSVQIAETRRQTEKIITLSR